MTVPPHEKIHSGDIDAGLGGCPREPTFLRRGKKCSRVGMDLGISVPRGKD